ncbi:INO80 complex subunit E isoform X4 [Erinaceus europaeus]|uniref:INO80 complex subunit E isoform X4 n=1 Tax=Erinaceus europaeus TaxID=9365 RepID=A0ABM3VXQ0_ERIEU|nr:INO80 complex subunit E isoform X4 [Erinaceus europaeus]
MNGPADGEVDYKKKYRNLKRKLKFLIYEHECFQEELRKAQRKLLKVSRDKSFLLDRLLQYENVDEDSSDGRGTSRLPRGGPADLPSPGFWGRGGGHPDAPAPSQDASPHDPELRPTANVQRRGQRGRRAGRGRRPGDRHPRVSKPTASRQLPQRRLLTPGAMPWPLTHQTRREHAGGPGGGLLPDRAPQGTASSEQPAGSTCRLREGQGPCGGGGPLGRAAVTGLGWFLS